MRHKILLFIAAPLVLVGCDDNSTSKKSRSDSDDSYSHNAPIKSSRRPASSASSGKGDFTDPRQAVHDAVIAEKVYEAIYAAVDSKVRSRTGKSAVFLLNPKNVDDMGIYASLIRDSGFVAGVVQLKSSSGVDMYEVVMQVLETELAKSGHPQFVGQQIRNEIAHKFWEKYLVPKIFADN